MTIRVHKSHKRTRNVSFGDTVRIQPARKRWVAIGCTHGGHIYRDGWRQFMQFVADYKPTVRMHLGDAFDTAAFRAGAIGTPDESASIGDDLVAGFAALQEYRPTVFFHGNHEDRLVQLANHPRATVAYAASRMLTDLTAWCDSTGCETVGYDIERGWRRLGDTLFGHGYMFSENAVRDHADSFGRCVIAHLHRVGMEPGRRLGAPVGYCVGCMAELPAMAYARRRRATLRWSCGWAFGEYTEDGTCEVNLRVVREMNNFVPPPLATR